MLGKAFRRSLSLMPENARYKLKETLERIINEGSGGLIAIIFKKQGLNGDLGHLILFFYVIGIKSNISK